MAKVRQIYEYRYRDGVLSRSIVHSWRPAKWHLGAGSAAYVANGPARVLLLPSVYLTIITPQGEALIFEAIRPNDVARAHQLAAEINRDAMLQARPSYLWGPWA